MQYPVEVRRGPAPLGATTLWALGACGWVTLQLLVAHIVAQAQGVPLMTFFGDRMNAVGEQPFYLGALESSGALMLAAGAGAALVMGIARPRYRRLLVPAGIFTLALAVDDLLMFHDTEGWGVGLPQKALYAGYALTVATILGLNPKLLPETAYPLLALALGCVALASGVDTLGFVEQALHAPRGTEEIAELFGFAFWTAYFVNVSLQAANELSSVSGANRN